MTPWPARTTSKTGPSVDTLWGVARFVFPARSARLSGNVFPDSSDRRQEGAPNGVAYILYIDSDGVVGQ